MKAQLIYSVAALATFPIVVNAQVNADNIGKITAKKDGTAWTKNIELAPGKYTFKSGISTGTAGKKATVSILNGSTPIVDNFDVTVGAAISKDFTLDATTTVTLKVVNQVNTADFIADGSVVQLNFNFSKVAELLQIEYNKVTQVLAEAQYDNKATDAQTHSALYDKIVSIANADYAFYKANTELQGIRNDQTQVSGLTLYSDIVNALTNVKTSEVAYLDGSNGLSGLDARYNSLKNDFGISYVTTALTASQTAAKSARDAFNSEPTAANLIDAKAKIKTYKEAIEKEEGVKTDNENANDYLKAELEKVYGGSTSYYTTSLAQIATQYADANSRYDNLKGQVEAALAAIVTGTGNFYDPVVTAINTQYNAKKSKEKKNDLINEIAAFKEKLTRVVSDYSTVRGQLAEVYDVYDAQDAAAKALVDGDATLKTYKDKVVAKVGDLLSFIKANDQFATVANLTKAAIQPYLDAIVTATNTYNDQSGIYGDYQALKDAVAAQTTSLNDAKTAVDADAKDAKKLDETLFKPTTIWATTISAIENLITTLDGNVDTKRATANTYKNTDEYKNALKKIKDQIAAFKTNANAATDIFATVDGKIKAANTLRAALLNPAVDPKVDLTTLNVWDNQVTIDDAVKARTPYKKFINSTDGTITDEISTMESALAAAPGKTAMLNAKGNNVDNILAYLKSIAPVPADVLKKELATMEAIKANYTADNEKFDQQIVQQQCAGIITMINDKAVVFATSIKALQDKVDAAIPTMSNANKAKLQTEINAITAKIDAAKAVAAKAGATKDELTAAYNKIKDLATTDIATAQANLSDYEASFTTSTGFYDTLKGGTTDPSTASTLSVLTKKVAEQKAAIDALAKLTDTQKNTLKGKVDAVEVVKQEGTPAVDVTYTLTKIQNDIEAAWQNETLNDGEVTRYQNIINDLKAETDKVKDHADRLNDLENQLSQINFTTAANNIKAKDPNKNGFYLKKLLGNAVVGECTFDFNKIKGDIEADVDITPAEKNTYEGNINTLKGTINGLPDLAENNYNNYKAAKDYYQEAPNGAVQKYNEYVQKLTNDRQTSALQSQLATLATLYDAMVEKFTVAGQHYDAGTASDADKNNIADKFNEIKNKYEEFYNEVNYNAQVAADNKAIYDAITAAHADANVAYAKASAAINTCKNFKSTDLKDATTAAATELQALLDYLKTYDTKVAGIQGNADADYAATVSPEFFDKDGAYKKQFEDIKDDIETLTKALSDKVREAAAAKVTATINSYSGAISISKGKVATFSKGDNLTEAKVADLFTAIDAMQKAIVDNNVEKADITALDIALARAEGAFVQTEGEVGIAARIVTVEQDQAQTALKEIIAQNTNSGYLTGNDKTLFNTINTAANSTSENKKKQCVDKFSTWKSNLNDLKTTADRLAAEYVAKTAAGTAIDNANHALDDLIDDYQKFAAGYQVKETVEQIAADLAAYDKTQVTPSNAAEWKTAAEGISERIEAVYVALYDFEVPVLEGLIDKAKDELVTYSKSDKATISANVTTEETNLNDVKTAVAKAPTAPGYKTKKSALLNELKSIETNLYTEITKLTEGNQTNINQAIIVNLNNLIAVEQGRMTTSLKLLNVGANDKYYTPVAGALKYYQVTPAINSEKTAIEGSIGKLNDYIADHEDQIVSYEANAKAMLEDIKAAVTTLERNVSLEVEKQSNKFVADDNTAIDNAKNAAQAKVTTADGQIARLVAQLGYYESSSKYANKINYLNAQLSDATDIMSDAKAAADATDVLKNKYQAFIVAQDDIDDALVGVQANCNEIEGQAKTAYINAFIADLDAQIIANTWTNNPNYTTTDQGVLTTKWNALKDYVNSTLKTAATNCSQAEDVKDGNNPVVKGVITTLNDGTVKFADDLEALKQAVKDLSLVEDVKGHISGNDDISTDDLEDLADIILNAQEESADMDRCDISGDGEVDVTDLVWLRYFLVHGDWPNSAATARGDMASANDYINMEVVSVENNVTRIAINLDNETVFNHFQLNVQLPEGAKVVGQTLGERVEGANLMMAQNGTTVRMLAISTANNVFAGNEGAVVYIDIEGLNGEVNIEKAIFTDTELNGHLLTANSTTSIRESITNALQAAGQKIYNMGGKMMNGLKKGVNIIRNADGSAKKVMK